MAHAERIIKSVMLPVGSPSSPHFAPPAQQQASSDQPPPAEGPPPTPTGFVMGPISAKAAEIFVKSFLQLIPTADLQILQKVLDMKGIKRSDQFTIIDEFRTALKSKQTQDQSESKEGSTITEHSTFAGSMKNLRCKK
ncbi:unnamed protein product [Mesocestoides corti]|uniref:Uncharacterized protein n=1 Tax=Mesocestoides corti TaxID=53468 RepID=A0A0R3UCP4_MESCO|nr:unnamed protein product [Mesocestoides corti]